MAINLSYDPSDDPEAIEAREAEEQESLELGEKMLKEQEELLAGKYKNVDELVKSYVGKLGENIKVARFVRFNVGETQDSGDSEDE